MRNLTLRVVIASWMAASSTAHAAPGDQNPLQPGKPAGMQQAQLSTPNTMMFVGLGVLVIGAGFYMASGNYKIPGTHSATSTR